MNQNGNQRNLSAVEVIDEDTIQTEPILYDRDNPVLQPAQERGKTKKRSWKRRLIGWSFALLLIGGGVVALYLLTRVSRVNVKVDADSPRNSQVTKANDQSTNADDKLTLEAINKAREAAGIDKASNPNGSASPNPSPEPSPKLQFNAGLRFNPNNSPATERFEDANQGNGNQQQKQDQNQTAQRINDPSLVSVSQNHANGTQSIFVDDAQVKSTVRLPLTPASLKSDKAAEPLIAKPPAAVLPPFGTMLPVRTQGVIFTLRNNSYARLELTRDCSGTGWSLPKGTVLVGRTSGSEVDRAFINVLGYIDPRDNKLVKVSGEVLGSDGASGISGKRITVDSNHFKQTLRKIALSGVQVAGTMAGALTGRGTVVIDSAGYRLMNPITDDARNALGGGSQRNSFV
ncbi:MAG TPA: hypothetical protein VHQ64_11315, partial [Pyrinomonadaceae bacterium]|nr:hypothetical protein [Pyrinomonadaceae bacterium]